MVLALYNRTSSAQAKNWTQFWVLIHCTIFDFPMCKEIVISWKVKESTTALDKNKNGDGESEEQEHTGK